MPPTAVSTTQRSVVFPEKRLPRLKSPELTVAKTYDLIEVGQADANSRLCRSVRMILSQGFLQKISRYPRRDHEFSMHADYR